MEFNRYRQLTPRFEAALEHIASAFRHEQRATPAFIVSDVPYLMTGIDPRDVPDGVYDEGAYAKMLSFQLPRIDKHVARFEDDFVPFVWPWYGTAVVPSALGVEVHFPEPTVPVAARPIIDRPDQVKRLVPPDPYRDGWMPRVLACIDYFRDNASLPVSVTDPQGPLSIARALVGIENISYWMVDYPTVVHELMDFCSSILIDWVLLQKKHAGQPVDSGHFAETIAIPEGFGGLMISDDDCVFFSPAMYKEFVVPYNSRVLLAFGGGGIHYCGSATQQIENFRNTDGLTLINTWTLGDFGAIRSLQQGLGERVTLSICDYTTLEPGAYFRGLLDVLDPRGVIIGNFPRAETALIGNRAALVDRDLDVTAEEAYVAFSPGGQPSFKVMRPEPGRCRGHHQ